MSTVAVIDFGMGNLRSVCKAIEHVCPQARITLTADPEEVRRAERVVFPGQGAIGGWVAALAARGLRGALMESLATRPFLGICLGLQALYEFSEEDGGAEGLGRLRGRVRRFPAADMIDAVTGRPLKIPHMGWNQVHQARAHPLWQGIPQDAYFYFVHSYYPESTRPEEVAGVTEYGIRFTSAASRANIFAVQFHPEKSQQSGLRLLENFMHWDGAC